MDSRTQDSLERQELGNLISSRRVEGTSVYNTRGESLGTVEHMMIDKLSGQVAYAVMSHGGVLGMGDKLFAVPWNALKVDEDEKCFILDVDKSRLENAPGFDREHWPDMADPAWSSRVEMQFAR